MIRSSILKSLILITVSFSSIGVFSHEEGKEIGYNCKETIKNSTRERHDRASYLILNVNSFCKGSSSLECEVIGNAAYIPCFHKFKVQIKLYSGGSCRVIRSIAIPNNCPY